jgi:hypothetical protein
MEAAGDGVARFGCPPSRICTGIPEAVYAAANAKPEPDKRRGAGLNQYSMLKSETM